MRRAVMVALLIGGLAAKADAEKRARYVVITHPRTDSSTVDPRFLADVFLKRITRWPTGEVIRPVDLRPDSAIRAQFSEEILGRSTASIRTLWQQALFAGRSLPPPELDGDA